MTMPAVRLPTLSRHLQLLCLIICTSIAARLLLIWGGGQFFFPDEDRYQTSRDAASLLLAGNVRAAIVTLGSPGHWFFKVTGVIPALVEEATCATPKIPACFFALFSVGSMWLMWRLALRLGGSERVALLSAAFLALSTTSFYYCRHLIPYDMSMFIGLATLLYALKPSPPWRDSMACGLGAAATFLTYNGYWVLAAFALMIHVLSSPLTPSNCLRRAGLAFVTLIAPIATLCVLGAALGGPFLQAMIRFADSVTQGSFAEGWSLPFEYLWHSEHFVAVTWAVLLIIGFVDLCRGSNRRIVWVSVCGVAFVYGVLVLGSVAAEKFVVYGRLVRQLVPFLCLLAAAELDVLFQRPRWRVVGLAILGLCVVQTCINFKAPLGQVFPIEFRDVAEDIIAAEPSHEYQLVNVKYIYEIPKHAPDSGRTILSAPHPISYLPYQYEGFTPNKREQLRAMDTRMRLVLLDEVQSATTGTAE